jgi:hypothetical protein
VSSLYFLFINISLATKQINGPESQTEKEMMLLYKHYLKKPAYLVDQMLGNVFLLK